MACVMAAIDLERGLEHSGRGWGQERLELMDNFDLEMQEWEDQLQNIQRKIEELYKDVQARRGANDITTDNQKNGSQMECGLPHNGNGFFAPSHHNKIHSGAISVPHCYSHGCNYKPNGYSCPVSYQNGHSYCHANGVSEIGELLQDYLEHGKQVSRKNNRARHVHFSDTIKVSQDIPAYQDDIRSKSGNERLGQEQVLGCFEETENRKNRVSHMKSSPCRESCPTNTENTDAKPPLGHRDALALQPRSQLPISNAEPPTSDRKSFSSGILGEKKCSSPSVLKKFGAMLQENEGKVLTESGVVTHQGPAPEPKCPTPACQRRAAGSTTGASKVPVHMPIQKRQVDSNLLTAEIEPSQEWGLVSDSVRQNHKDQRGGYSSCKGPHSSPRQSQRSQVAGSPNVRPRANSVTDRFGGRKPGHQHAEPKMDYRVSSASSGAQRIQRGGLVGQEMPDCSQVRDEGLIELLDMLDIQHEYSSSPKTGHTDYRQEPQQVNPAELSPVKPKRSFSRPARPANQRPPSRWASHTSTARIATTSFPMYQPPSLITHPPSPMTRNPSPALKHRPLFSYSLQTETVIM
uniref:uncharacterized protein LOC109952222 n=1 Tax=Monopterus albus TaxID=43700 RepID=UPI0009B3643E|nr:uncharacterized protein LOC109952222 [Monopterus albus]